MLGKLFKHEMRATTRMYLPLFGLLAVLTALNKLMGLFNAQEGASSVELWSSQQNGSLIPPDTTYNLPQMPPQTLWVSGVS
ncbi:MAG: hypothetical protein EOM69_02750, partial [Clostridia bacterium]|nr:hypothetical protein [Clostridia bacterium]